MEYLQAIFFTHYMGLFLGIIEEDKSRIFIFPNQGELKGIVCVPFSSLSLRDSTKENIMELYE